MLDPIRETLQAAQAAEVRGHRGEAAALLKRAAALYEQSGRAHRAEQILRHAQRLLEPAEAESPAEPVRPVRNGGSSATARGGLLERGPTRAGADTSAWCSFCCRPTGEVGALAAGPAGAFICRACLTECEGLLGSGGQTARDPDPPPAPAVAPNLPLLPKQRAAVDAVALVLRRGARCVLLCGPAGAGKSTVLRALAQGTQGRLVHDAQALSGGGALGLVELPEDSDRAGVLAQAALGASFGQRVLAIRAQPPRPAWMLQGAEEERPLHATEEIQRATGLSGRVAEAVDAVVALAPLSQAELTKLAASLLAERGVKLEGARRLGRQGAWALLARAAIRSGRGGHELRALVDRIPPGPWSVRQAPRGRRGR